MLRRPQHGRRFCGARLDDVSLFHVVLDSTAIPFDVCVDVVARIAAERAG